MIRATIIALVLTMALPAAAQGGGGGDRPTTPISVTPMEPWTVELAIMEARRRLYCLALPWNCQVEPSPTPEKRRGGNCGDVFLTMEEANYYCPRKSQVQKIFLRQAYTCDCYGSFLKDI
jgi:hypothetical protein